MKNKKIYRNQTNELVAGVCSGLADYFEIDATLVRIIFVVLGIGGGSGVLIYLVLWFVIPRENEVNMGKEEQLENVGKEIEGKVKIAAKEIKKEVKTEKRSGDFLGMVLVILGGVLLVEKIAPRFIDWDYFWPMILIVLGAYLIFRKR